MDSDFFTHSLECSSGPDFGLIRFGSNRRVFFKGPVHPQNQKKNACFSLLPVVLLFCCGDVCPLSLSLECSGTRWHSTFRMKKKNTFEKLTCIFDLLLNRPFNCRTSQVCTGTLKLINMSQRHGTKSDCMDCLRGGDLFLNNSHVFFHPGAQI